MEVIEINILHLNKFQNAFPVALPAVLRVKADKAEVNFDYETLDIFSKGENVVNNPILLALFLIIFQFCEELV